VSITIPAQVTNHASGASSLALQLTGVTVGDIVVVLVGMNLNGATPGDVSGVADDQGNTYSRADGGLAHFGTGATGERLAYYIAPVVHGGTLNITVSVSNGPPTDLVGAAFDVSVDDGGVLQFGGYTGNFGGGNAIGGNFAGLVLPALQNADMMVLYGMAAAANTPALQPSNTDLVDALTDSGACYLFASAYGPGASGYAAVNVGWKFGAGGTNWTKGAIGIYEFKPVVCAAAPPAGGIAVVGVGAGFADSGPGIGALPYNDPVRIALRSVPAGSAILVAVGKTPLSSVAYNVSAVSDGANGYTRLLNQGDGAVSPYLALEVWGAFDVPAGDYTLSVSLQHNDSALEDTPVTVVVVAPPAGAAGLALDTTGAYNGDNLTPGATEGMCNGTVTKAFAAVLSFCVALPADSSTTQWDASADSALQSQAQSSVTTETVAAYLLNAPPQGPGTYATTQPWHGGGTNNWVDVAVSAGIGSLTPPSGGGTNYTQEVGQPCVQGSPAPIVPTRTTPKEETQPAGVGLENVPGNFYDRCDTVYKTPQGRILPLGPKQP
jgi:hypothetical protein